MLKSRTIQTALGSRAFAPAPVMQFQSQHRNIQDVAISRTGRPILKVQGGRHSLGGHTATVFGATGFLGRLIVDRLASQGCNVVIPYRNLYECRHLKVTGDLGRVTYIEYDLRNTQSIEESVRHSDVVYNLVGRQFPTKNFSYEDVHVDGAERIAEAVAKYDVDRFIHVSSYNAKRDSPSEYWSTKAWGEEVVRNIFPETTIVRPAPMFGSECGLIHRLARATHVLTANHSQQRFWPVHAPQVAEGLERIMHTDSSVGQTYELYGPTNFSMAEISELVDTEIIKTNRITVNVPKFIAKPAAYFINKALWWDLTSADEIERQFHDQVIDPTAKTFKDLGMETTPEIADVIFGYLKSFRKSTYYDLPPMSDAERGQEKNFVHVLNQ